MRPVFLLILAICAATPVAGLPKNASKDCFPGVEPHADKQVCGVLVSHNIQNWFDNNEMSGAQPNLARNLGSGKSGG